MNKHPTNRTNLELFRKDVADTIADVELVTKKIESLKRVLKVAEMTRDSAVKAYENALANAGNARATRSYPLRSRPCVVRKGVTKRDTLQTDGGSMVAMLLGLVAS